MYYLYRRLDYRRIMIGEFGLWPLVWALTDLSHLNGISSTALEFECLQAVDLPKQSFSHKEAQKLKGFCRFF
jgi:hypothetical protein